MANEKTVMIKERYPQIYCNCQPHFHEGALYGTDLHQMRRPSRSRPCVIGHQRVPYREIWPVASCLLKRTAEYRKALQTCVALMEQLFQRQRLSKEEYALVEQLRAQNAIAQCEESESHFKYGFSAGLIVQQEAQGQMQNNK